MSTSAIGVGGAVDVSGDFQVQRLESQIKDWTNCPTTPKPQKQVIVARLQSQLDGVESALKQSGSVKAAESPDPVKASRLDIKA